MNSPGEIGAVLLDDDFSVVNLSSFYNFNYINTGRLRGNINISNFVTVSKLSNEELPLNLLRPFTSRAAVGLLVRIPVFRNVNTVPLPFACHKPCEKAFIWRRK